MKRTFVPLLVPALLLLAGCGGGDGGSDGPGAPLEGTTWNLTLIEGESFTLPEGLTTPLLRFDAEGRRAAGSTGCNSVTAAYTTDGESLTFGNAVSTRKACPDMFLETAFLGALGNTTRHRIEGRDLVLLDAGGKELLRFTAETAE